VKKEYKYHSKKILFLKRNKGWKIRKIADELVTTFSWFHTFCKLMKGAGWG
jgi:hypothetical protein